MVLLWKPLFSDAASGAFYDTIVYRNTSPQQTAARMPRPSLVSSPAQLLQRALFQSAVAAWHALSPSEQAAYEASAPDGQNGYNYFLSVFMTA